MCLACNMDFERYIAGEQGSVLSSTDKTYTRAPTPRDGRSGWPEPDRSKEPGFRMLFKRSFNSRTLEGWNARLAWAVKFEPRIWYGVHATVDTFSNCATRAHSPIYSQKICLASVNAIPYLLSNKVKP